MLVLKCFLTTSFKQFGIFYLNVCRYCGPIFFKADDQGLLQTLYKVCFIFIAMIAVAQKSNK